MPPKSIKGKKNTKDQSKAPAQKEMTSKAFQTLAIFYFFSALLIAAYEVVRHYFFSPDLLPELFTAFKNPFLLAKIWLFVAAVAGGVEMLRKNERGLLFGLLAGSSFLFLGLADLMFNARQGFYSVLNFPVIFESAVNLYSLFFGIYSIMFVWENRGMFLPEKKTLPLVKKKKW